MTVRYTVKQVSGLTGVAADRLRAWERRYGVVEPGRSESRYRLYDDVDVARLRKMAELVQAGTPASLAAEQVRDLRAITGRDGTVSLVRPGSPGRGGEQSTGRDGAPRSDDGQTPAPTSEGGASRRDGWVTLDLSSTGLPPVEALIPPARSLDRISLDRTLDQAFSVGSFELVFERWLTPALARLGKAWADGLIDVGGEHFVSAAVHRRLSRAFEAAGPQDGGPVVIVGLPPGAMHELGSLALATCLRRLGADVRYLGRDLPVTSWTHAVEQLRPAAVTVSVPVASDDASARVLVEVLARTPEPPAIYVGGRGCGTDWPEELGATLLEGGVVEAAREMVAELR
ncbi:MerR family transcriptional regulator [uncultured Ornithinimicrobium sp.]|uniref:MerR family transcriptional regulator n=1 Tax=uncultured Ornithinimicrobium sp. TaxID=259307 RepID=UPI002595C443|nr:MerR family transcriptional regulator [uncultured Ornithinimicrobium sp.]